MTILVTGGAGYIGSVTVETLHARGRKVVVLDNLFRGHRSAVDSEIPFYQGDIADRELVARIVAEHGVTACVHFAAVAFVAESVADPGLYYLNNFTKCQSLLDALRENGVNRFVFSSTCATYGLPVEMPMTESHPQNPVNPYGWSKFFVERLLENYDAAHKTKFVALRYFNASGATERVGEHHEPETHLIPNILRAAQGKLPFVNVFGTDYPTPDGTAIRDYIHVSDLADAHIAALDYLAEGGKSEFINLGTGTGYSVLEVIEAARRVTGRSIEVKYGERRAGDPPRLVANSSKAREVLGWKPCFDDLGAIVASAWAWHERHPDGYID